MGIRKYLVGLVCVMALFTVMPSYADDNGSQDGKMMDGKMMDGKMDSSDMKHYKPMQEVLGMVREMMVMMKGMNHQPTPEQSAKLDTMITRLDEIIKEHEDMMKKRQEWRDKKRDNKRDKMKNMK